MVMERKQYQCLGSTKPTAPAGKAPRFHVHCILILSFAFSPLLRSESSLPMAVAVACRVTSRGSVGHDATQSRWLGSHPYCVGACSLVRLQLIRALVMRERLSHAEEAKHLPLAPNGSISATLSECDGVDLRYVSDW